MTKLHNIIAANGSLAALYPDLQESLAIVAEMATDQGSPSRFMVTQSRGGVEVGEQIATFLHEILWQQAQPTFSYPPFERIWAGRLAKSLTGFSVESHKLTHAEMLRMVEAGERLLRGNGLVRKPARNTYLLRPIPVGHKWRGVWGHTSLNAIEKAMINKQVEETQRPVTTRHDLSVIPIPSPLTPESAKKYIEQIADAYRRLATRVANLETENQNLENKLKELANSSWMAVADDIKALVSQ